MNMSFFDIYDAIIASVASEDEITSHYIGEHFSLIETKSSCGIAMSTFADTIPPFFTAVDGLSLKTFAMACKSWNLDEASLGLAAVNAALNTPERIRYLRAEESYENYCTTGLDFRGKTVGIIGHMKGPVGLYNESKKVYIIERNPRPGDYPDAACELLLPQCDIVLITGSSIVNKTLPRLLELSRYAYTILTGPSVPLCPALLDFGVDRIAGMSVADLAALKNSGALDRGSPYRFGPTFMLHK